jgi:DNA polymerase-3 subunit epsilon
LLKLMTFEVNLPKTIVAIDVETTGLYSHDRIVTLGAWKVSAAELAADVFHPECIHIIVDPGKKSHPKAEAIHGYSDWILRHQQPFAEYARTVRDFIESGEVVVAHNASFDMEFIAREYRALGQAPPTLPIYCTMNSYRQAGLPGRASLDAICQMLKLHRSSQKHGSIEDAWLALMVYFWLNRAPPRAILPFAEIAKVGIPVSPSNFMEPPPIPEGGAPTRRAAIVEEVRQLAAEKLAAKKKLMKAVRATAILLLEVARSDDSLASEEIDILVALIGAVRERLGMEADGEIEFEVLAELFDVRLSQNQLTRCARAMCADAAARDEFPSWFATMASIDSIISVQQQAAMERVKSAIRRVLP